MRKIVTTDLELLVPFGDLHIGYGTMNRKKVYEVIDFIDKNECQWIGMGDYIDNTPPKHKYFDFDTAEMSPQDQVIEFTEMIEGIKDRCIGLLNGNHEVRSITSGYDPVKQILKILKMPKEKHLRSIHAFNIKTGRVKYDIFATHGSARGLYFSTRQGYKISKLLSLSTLADADLYLMGHLHDIINTSNQKIAVENGKMVLKTKWYAMTGGFVEYIDFSKNLESYGASMGYTPIETGTNVIYFEKGHKEIYVERIV